MYSILEDLLDLSVQNFHQKNNFRIVFLCFPIPVPFVQCVIHDFIACEFASVCLLFWYQPLHSWGWVAIQGSLFWSFTRWTISTCPSWAGLQKVFKSTLHPIVSTVSLPKLFLYLYSCRQAIRAYMRQYWPLVNLRPWLPLAIKLSLKSAVTAEIPKKEIHEWDFCSPITMTSLLLDQVYPSQRNPQNILQNVLKKTQNSLHM